MKPTLCKWSLAAGLLDEHMILHDTDIIVVSNLQRRKKKSKDTN